jgi:hypothetical protein
MNIKIEQGTRSKITTTSQHSRKVHEQSASRIDEQMSHIIKQGVTKGVTSLSKE